jgi:hypothetical protein
MMTHQSAPPRFDRELRAAMSTACANEQKYATNSPMVIAAAPKIFGRTLIGSFTVTGVSGLPKLTHPGR